MAGRAAERLRAEWGATRVVLHGSYARGSGHERSDIDLAVEGVAAGRIFDAGAALDDGCAPFDLDLVRIEGLPSSVRARLDREGVEL